MRYGLLAYLSYLALDGFFPGYALTRESVTALSLDPFIEVSRPSPVALRELTPANFVYANKHVFRVTKLHLHGVQANADDTVRAALQRHFALDKASDRLIDLDEAGMQGGLGSDVTRITSLQLTDVEMKRKDEINDSDPARRRVGFVMHGSTADRHGGGEFFTVNFRDGKRLHRQLVRLVNLGLSKGGPVMGFPLCPICGATRPPKSSQAEYDAIWAPPRSRASSSLRAPEPSAWSCTTPCRAARAFCRRSLPTGRRSAAERANPSRPAPRPARTPTSTLRVSSASFWSSGRQ